MPFSSNSGKDYIRSVVGNPQTVLDVGAGSGTYKKMFAEWQDTHWTAIEIWEPYVDKYNLSGLYNQVIVSDVREWQPLWQYDVCFCGDILEHMTEQQAIEVLAKLRKCCDKVIISIPLGHYPQEEYDGNPYEAHVVDNWTHERVVQAFGQPKQHHIDNEIGVYVYQKLKIAVYAISKNEEMFAERFCKSAEAADLILIADTGSTDNTAQIARDNGAVVYDISVKPWRFDKARDTALNLIPGDFDVCISLDLDEILEPGWREEIERVWQGNTTRLRYKFDWGCGISFFYEKIHHRTGYHWHHPVHEYPRPDNRTVEVYAHTDMLLVSHHPDNTKSRGQYMPLLELAIAEDPKCPRNAFYHARELTFYNRWDDAIKYLQKYLDMPEATWLNERCYAMRLMGKSFEHIGQPHVALKWYRLAVAEAPGTREPWVELSMLCYQLRMWPESFSAAMSALEIKDKQLVYTMDPSVWTEKPHDLASIAAWNMGLGDIARQQLEEALKFAPNDARLLANREFMKDENGIGTYGNGSAAEQSRSGLRPTIRTNQRPIETA